MILLLAGAVAVVIALLLLVAVVCHRGGYASGYSHARVDWYRRGWRESDGSGTWPQTPEKRPGVMEEL